MDSAHLTPSQEDYLEAVYRISEEKKAARAKDIADRLNVRASSVTAALRTSKRAGSRRRTPCCSN